MKSKVKNEKVVMAVKPFPKLMIASDGVIVLFESKRNGVVVSHNGGFTTTAVGESCNEWHMGSFEDFDGEVILSND